MRILFLSTWFPYPPDNGSKLRAYYLVKSAAEQHEVTVVAFRPEGSGQYGDIDGHISEQRVVAVSDDPYRYVNIPQWAKYISLSPVAFRTSQAMQETVAVHARRGPWDLVVALQIPVAQYALQVKAAAYVVDVDTAMTYQMRERCLAQQRLLARASTWISWQKAFRYESAMLRRFQTATVVSEAEADYLRRMVKTDNCQVALVPNGVDCEHNTPGSVRVHHTALIYNGSLTYSANYDAMRWFLGEIYPLIKAGEPEVRLSITGSTNNVDIKSLALDHSITLTGFVEDVRFPVKQAAICVVPLRQGGGTRLKILESMALGTPVISTSKGAEGLEVVDGEHLILADTPAAFARATLTLLADADMRADLANNARRLVEDKYDWLKIGRSFTSLLEDTVSRRQGALYPKVSV